MPDDFRDALIVSLYKNKGSKSDCGNYRGISLLSIAGKIFARVMLNRLITVSEQNLPEAQCGVRPRRSTVDMIFAMRQLQEKCIEQSMPLFSVFIDLTKAFDTVNREALWTVLERIGCPPKFISMIRLFHDGMTGQVFSHGNVTEAFAISNRMKQGCILAPVLFNIFFTCMLPHTVHDLEKGVYIRYCLDSSLFDLRRLAVKTKRMQSLLQELLFADDCALVAHTEPDLQLMQDRFSSASKLFSLTVSLGKTKVLHQPAPHTHPASPNIIIDDTPLGFLDKEIVTRISKASQALGRLRNRVLNQHNIRLLTKLKIYNAVVLPSLLYDCETWTLYRRHVKKLESFHMGALRSILGIKWQDCITNLEVPDCANSTSIESMLIKAQLRWVGHVIRMEEFRISRCLMYGELQLGKRNQGRPKLRYKDTVKANLQWCHIKPKELEERAMDRAKWRALTHNAAANYEEVRHQKLTAAREKRHRAVSAVITTTDFQCPNCSRLCASRLGLQSHLRVHR